MSGFWALLAYEADEDGEPDPGKLVGEYHENNRLAIDSRLGQLLQEHAPHDAEWSTWRYAGVDGTGTLHLDLISVDSPGSEWTLWLTVEIYGHD